ncbi:hypothetical protein C6558_03395 [Ensifer sp. NM-2]|uniref:Arc family DNA-binding protein n=1 Tax=Ensifer sp. NM-2 TaxID=2109730 RepID=UPI000D133A74|nr:Arc family DNA-binding protein [Ensifer sp. NM-2]PSS67071.1 hypothetical protein C6558_03395 [Ensifer sp. NM-2]
MARQQYPSDKQDQFMVRLPNGMRDRMKTEADQNGRSMNAEIVSRLERSFKALPFIPDDLLERIAVYAQRQGRTAPEEILRLLEREYPKQWDIADRMEHLSNLLAIMTSGAADSKIDQFVKEMQETVEGVVNGRVKGIEPTVREEVRSLWHSYRERLSEIEYDHQKSQHLLDEEELRMQELTGGTEKLADPLPPEPNPWEDSIFLSRILPAHALAELANKFREGNFEAAAVLVRNMPKKEIEERVRFEQLPLEARHRILREEPPSRLGDDPFKMDD